MIRQLTNYGYLSILTPGITLSSRLLNNALSLYGACSLSVVKRCGTEDYNDVIFNYSANAAYSFSNFYVSASVMGKTKNVNAWDIIVAPLSYNFDFGWGASNLNVEISAIYIFSSSYRGDVENFSGQSYKYTTQNLTPVSFRSFELSVTYSFSYGRKVNREEISDQDVVQSGILK